MMKKRILLMTVLFFSLFIVACNDNSQIEKCEHTFNIVDQVQATCREGGIIYYTCTQCGTMKEEITPILEHKWGDWHVIVDPTISTDGDEYRECLMCGEIENRKVPKLDHEHCYELINEKEESCVEDGFKEYQCSCGSYYIETIYHQGHAFSEWKVIKDSSCTETGTKERTCSTCGYTETETISSISHIFIDGICNDCGKIDTSYLHFTLNSDEQSYTVSSCASDVTNVIIPATYNGLPVTNIRKGIFGECNNIKSLTVPFVGLSLETNVSYETSIRYLFASEYDHNYSIPITLDTITVTGGNISGNAFDTCYNIKKIVITEPVTNIDSGALSQCYQLEEILFPNTMKTIHSQFFSMPNLRRIDLSHCSELTYLASFINMENLEEVILPNCVEYFEGFSDCPKLSKFNCPSFITEIPNGFLSNCPLITSFEIPEGVTRIGNSAFLNSAIISINIPSTVKSIGYGAFWGCENLVTVSIEDGVESLDDNVFKGCIKLQEIILPSTLISVGCCVFNGCKELKKLTIPFVGCTIDEKEISSSTFFGYIFGNSSYEGSYEVKGEYHSENQNYISYFYVPTSLTDVTVLGGKIFDNAFTNCNQIENIVIGNEVKSIGNSAFLSCTNLQTLEFMPNSQLVSIGNNAFSGVSLYKFVIPSSVESIGNYAFSEIDNLSMVSFEEDSHIKSIGTCAFLSCISLKEIIIPTSLEKIGIDVFGYTMLEKISIPFLGSEIGATTKQNLEYYFGSTIPNTLKTVEISAGTEIPSNAFWGSCVENIKLSATIEKINESAFERCFYLKTVECEDGSNLKKIGNSAFENCRSLTTFKIPSGLIELSSSVFSNCSALETITIPNNIVNIGEKAFYECNSLEEVIFQKDSNLERVGKEAFANCKKLLKIEFGDSLKYIDDKAFTSCENLNEVVLPNTLLSLGNEAFSSCYNITSIVLPNSLEYIGEHTLSFCNNLMSLTVPYIGSGIEKENSKTISYFCGSYNLENIKVTNAKYIADYCFEFTSVRRNNKITKIELSDTIEEVGKMVLSGLNKLETLTIPFIGSTKDDNETYSLSTNYGSAYDLQSLKELTILYVTFIGEDVFLDSFNNFNNLEIVNLPSMLERVEDYAFYNCKKLKNVNFAPSSILEEIGEFAFSCCYNLEKINLPEGLKTIGSSAFSCCYNLEKINLPEGLRTIGSSAFDNCRSLEEIKLPENISILNSYTFAHCTSLSKIVINESISEICEDVFLGCSSVKKLEIPVNVKKIASGAFSQMISLEEITLPVDNVLGYYFGNEKYQGSMSQKIDMNIIYYVPEKLTKVNIIGGEIVSHAFYKLENVNEINIVNNVNSIGPYAFTGMTNLEELNIYSCAPTIQRYAFDGVGNQLNWLNPIIKCITSYFYDGYIGDVIVIPSSVETIQPLSFYGTASKIDWNDVQIETIIASLFHGYNGSEIVLPSSVVTIDTYAFSGYNGEMITISSNVKKIKENAFSNYAGEIAWDNPTIEKIESYTFMDFLGTELTIPDSVIEIEENALYNCINLEELVIPFVGSKLTPSDSNSSTNVFGYIFGGLSTDKFKVAKQEYEISYSDDEENVSNDGNLIKEYKIPLSLKKVTVTGGKIGHGAFSDCSMLQSIDVSSCQEVLKYAFLKCSNLIDVKLPENIKYFSKGIFKDCIKLTKFEFSSNVNVIGEEAFSNCVNLRTVILSENIDYIMYNAFYQCYQLSEVYNFVMLQYI